MNDYLLFIDTEASGLPANWILPLTDDSNWPHAVQASWIIYDKNQSLIKKENHYIKNDDFTIVKSAMDTHGITNDFLAKNGEDRIVVLQLLVADLLKYQPMIIGHFIRLDYYILSADFYRSAISNPLSKLPVFCTMVASKELVWNPMPKYLRLEDLYAFLFHKELKDQHNALNDAQATADCFFELLNRDEINDAYIVRQTADFERYRDPVNRQNGCIVPVLIAIILFISIIWYYEQTTGIS